MSLEKIEQRLEEEMQRVENTRSRNQEIPVLIELEPLTVGQGGIQTLEERAQAAQRRIRKKLEELGAEKTMRPMTLANAVEARLTPAGIREIAALREVTKILWNRAERVTA